MDERTPDAQTEPQTVSPSSDEVTQTLAHIRHELRTPLNHILGYAELLIDQAEEEGKEEWKQDLEKIQGAGRRLLELMSLLLTENPPSRLYIPPGTTSNGVGKSVTFAAMTGEKPELESVVSLASRKTTTETGQTIIPAQLPLLVVDDEPNNREVLVRLLRQMGYTVEEADNGKTALQLITQNAYDVVFLDIMMPVMDGFQTLQAINADDVLKYTPVIMISALDELQVVAHCIEAGAQDYLPKPFNSTLLKARLAATLERKQLRDQEQELFAQLAEAHARLQEVDQLRGTMMQDLMGDLRVMLTASQKP